MDERTGWTPLRIAMRNAPDLGGVYRIRREGALRADYIGETGPGASSFRKRLSSLTSVYAPEMPYRYPYAAAPALWALRDNAGELEVSLHPVVDSSARLGTWATEVALFRQEHGRSPTANFGRMPKGYRSSSSYSCALMHAGGLYRGGRTDHPDERHMPGRKPLGVLSANPRAGDWCGASWSDWSATEPPPHTRGILRARGSGERELTALAGGLLRPLTKRLRSSASADRVEWSWFSTDSWPEHHRDEVLADLLGAYFLHVGELPSAQARRR